MAYEIVIGLETHTQLSTQTKIFSGSSTRYGAQPNTQANEVDMALPGTLPVMNRAAVEHAIRLGLAVGGYGVALGGDGFVYGVLVVGFHGLLL